MKHILKSLFVVWPLACLAVTLWVCWLVLRAGPIIFYGDNRTELWWVLISFHIFGLICVEAACVRVNKTTSKTKTMIGVYVVMTVVATAFFTLVEPGWAILLLSPFCLTFPILYFLVIGSAIRIAIDPKSLEEKEKEMEK